MKRTESFRSCMGASLVFCGLGVLFGFTLEMDGEPLGRIIIYGVLSLLGFIMLGVLVGVAIKILETLDEFLERATQAVAQPSNKPAPNTAPEPPGKPVYVIDEPEADAK